MSRLPSRRAARRCAASDAAKAAALIATVALTGCAGSMAGPGFSGDAPGADSGDHWMYAYNPRTQGRSPADLDREFNLFRGQWWNYYARGRWFFELGDPERAAADFRVAIGQRRDDERDARSYGMHFWEYFPHRELGVALFSLQRYEEAAGELERSLGTADSGRAKFYLNKARASVLRRSGRDNAPPDIVVEPVGGGGIVNSPSIVLRGAATDDTWVAGLRVAGMPLFVELAEPRIAFAHPVTLRAGVNTVRIEAEDLLGRVNGVEVRIILDRTPPVLAIDASAGTNEVRCYAADDRGLAEIVVDGQAVSCGGDPHCSTLLNSRGSRALIEVRDLAGNVTRADVDVREMTEPRGKGAFVPGAAPGAWQLAALHETEGMVSDAGPPLARLGLAGRGWGVAAATGQDKDPPRVRLDLPHQDTRFTTVDEDFFLDGELYDPGGLSTLSVNDEPIPLPQPGATKAVFNHLVALRYGSNRIEVKATDRTGNIGVERFEVQRESSEILSEGVRYSVGFLPPDRKPSDTPVGESAYEALLDSILREPVRFRLLERDRGALEQILLEQKLTNLAARGTAVKLGKIISAEGMLFGRVTEDRLGIVLELRLVDTETTEVLVTADVYGEEKDARSLRWLANGLVSKIKVGFPVLQGEVLRTEGNQVRVNLGTQQGLHQGMRLLFYRQEANGGLVAQKLLRLGDAVLQARVTELGKGEAIAELINVKGRSPVRVKDRIVTK